MQARTPFVTHSGAKVSIFFLHHVQPQMGSEFTHQALADVIEGADKEERPDHTKETRAEPLTNLSRHSLPRGPHLGPLGTPARTPA